MDPNKTLANMLSIASDFIEAVDRDGAETVDAADACELAELVQALDGWMRKGGFLPDAWAKGRKEAQA